MNNTKRGHARATRKWLRCKGWRNWSGDKGVFWTSPSFPKDTYTFHQAVKIQRSREALSELTAEAQRLGLYDEQQQRERGECQIKPRN